MEVAHEPAHIIQTTSQSGSNQDGGHGLLRVQGKTKTFAKMVTPSQLKIGLVQVLEDQLPYPLTCSEFHAFLIQEHSEENIEFYFALRGYKRMCEGIDENVLRNKSESGLSASSTPYSSAAVSTSTLPSTSTNNLTTTVPDFSNAPPLPGSQPRPGKEPQHPEPAPSTDANLTSAESIDTIREAAKLILSTFFRPDCERELNVPALIIKKLINSIEIDGNLHPDVFTPALETILTMMRLSSFPNFYKQASTKYDEDHQANSSLNKSTRSLKKSVSADSIPASEFERRKSILKNLENTATPSPKDTSISNQQRMRRGISMFGQSAISGLFSPVSGSPRASATISSPVAKRESALSRTGANKEPESDDDDDGNARRERKAKQSKIFAKAMSVFQKKDFVHGKPRYSEPVKAGGDRSQEEPPTQNQNPIEEENE